MRRCCCANSASARDRCHLLTWVYNGTEVPFDELIDNDIDISVGSLAGIDALADAARRLGKPARVHVKVDSGFGRNGFTPAGFDAALCQAGAACA